MPPSRRVVGVLSFLRGALLRSVGLGPKFKWGVDLELRSTMFLSRLNEPADDLHRRMALADLRHQYDLLVDESALIPDCLALQKRVYEMADTDPMAAELVRMQEMNVAPSFFGAIVTQASKVGATSVRIDFGSPDDDKLTGWHRVGEAWTEALTLPASLADSLRGVAMLVAALGYPAWRRHQPEPNDLPPAATISWPTKDQLLIVLSAE